MKKLLLTVLTLAVMCTAQTAMGQEMIFADNELSLSQIEKQWHNAHIYAIQEPEHATIDQFVLAFSQAYPNYLCNRVVAKMLGVGQDGYIGDYVLDKKNGFFHAEGLAELTESIEMCYWRCSDGGVIVAVALQGDEYVYDESVPIEEQTCDDRTTQCLNDLMFYRINPDELLMRPITPNAMCGRSFNFEKYEIKLPQDGRDIVLNPIEDNTPGYTLKWNGKDFDAIKR